MGTRVRGEGLEDLLVPKVSLGTELFAKLQFRDSSIAWGIRNRVSGKNTLPNWSFSEGITLWGNEEEVEGVVQIEVEKIPIPESGWE